MAKGETAKVRASREARLMELLEKGMDSGVWQYAIAGALSGAAGQFPWTIEITQGPVVTFWYDYPAPGVPKTARLRMTVTVTNFLNSTLALDLGGGGVNLGIFGSFTSSSTHLGWPNKFAVEVEVPGASNMTWEKLSLAARTKAIQATQSYLILTGAGAGAAFGLGMAALAGALSSLRRSASP